MIDDNQIDECFVDAMFPGEFTQEESDILRALLEDIEWNSQHPNYPYSAVRNAAVADRLEKVRKRLGVYALSVLETAVSPVAENQAFDRIREIAKLAVSELEDVYVRQNVAT